MFFLLPLDGVFGFGVENFARGFSLKVFRWRMSAMKPARICVCNIRHLVLMSFWAQVYKKGPKDGRTDERIDGQTDAICPVM